MAQIEGLVEHLIKWETSTYRKTGESLKALYTRALAKGITEDKWDAGGATCVGITLSTFKLYNDGKGNKKALSEMTYSEWLDILNRGFWQRWQADRIGSQSVANMLVDWLWHSGIYGIKIPQRVLGVDADGIVGEKTLSAITEHQPKELFNLLKQERLAYIGRLCSSRNGNLRYKAGWENRINDLKFIDSDE